MNAEATKERSLFGKISRAGLLALLFAVLTLALCACNLFDSASLIGNVSLNIETLPEEEDGNYYVTLGEEVVFTLDWENEFVTEPSIVWYLEKGGERKVLEEKTTSAVRLVFEEYSDDLYSVYATVNKKEVQEKFEFYLKYASLSRYGFTSSSGSVVSGHFQQNMLDAEAVPESITFGTEWDDTYLDPLAVYGFSWSLYGGGSELAASSDALFTMQTSSVSQPEVFELECTITSESVSVSQTLSIEFLYIYEEVESVSLALTDGADKTPSGLYVQTAYPGLGCAAVSFESSVFPETGTDINAAAVWTLRNANGTSVLDSDSRSVSFVPAYGKNVLDASIDNVVSRTFTFYVLDSSDFSDTRIKTALNTKFIWDGSAQDCYLMDKYDVGALINYMVSKHRTARYSEDDASFDIYLQPSQWKGVAGKTTEAFRSVVSDCIKNVDESGSFRLSFSTTFMYLTEDETYFGYPLQPYPTEYTVTQINQDLNYSENYSHETSSRDVLPVDGFTDTLEVYNSNDLYRALGWGYRPVFENSDGGRVLKALYDKARATLSRICDDNMSDLEKVRAIYQWICSEVDYDYGAANDSQPTQTRINYNAFYLEGVFDDFRAVCDGKSKAFVLLCGMEGIKALRILGTAAQSGNAANGEGHAWNKVLIDADGDSVKEWYVADTTWGDLGVGSGTYVNEFVTASYFLVTDETIQNTHYSAQSQPAAVTDYNAFENSVFVYDGTEYSAYIDSEEDLYAAMSYLLEKKPKALDIRVNLYGVNSASELKECISSVMGSYGGIRTANLDIVPSSTRTSKNYIVYVYPRTLDF